MRSVKGRAPCFARHPALALPAVYVVLCALSSVLFGLPSQALEPREIFRVRVENVDRGRVQVSIDGGKTYATVGHVRRHAVAVYAGFAASAYVPDATVAATAVHGIRLKTGTTGSGKDRKPLTFSLVPLEFDETPNRYGGHIPYGSGIYTDIRAGTAIFRTFAPFVGSPVRLERNGALVDLAAGYQPHEGDAIVIIGRLPQPYLRELVFENRAGGAVTATYDDGRSEQVATVIRPVKGVGRFDGTSYTGVGLINTSHGGVLTVSTAAIPGPRRPGGNSRERRGGFQIQPLVHAETQPYMPQAMVVGPVEGGTPLEGKPPIFSGFISLAYDFSDPANSCRVEVSVQDGPWQPMPETVGRHDSALSELGVTGIRIEFPSYDGKFLARTLAEGKRAVLRRSTVLRGIVPLRPSRAPEPGSLVSFYLGDRLPDTTTEPPYEFTWDTRSVLNGEYDISIRTTDAWGQEVRSETRRVVVENP